MYLGQVLEIRKQISNVTREKGVKITSVDNY
jgi:hypothetical protein